jgi:hypothetical protein
MADNLPIPSDPAAIAREIGVIQDRMRDDNAAYRADQGMQDRYLALLRAREGHPSPRISADAAEIERIRGLMADPHSEYWRGNHSGELQGRYRELVARRDGVAHGTERRKLSPAPARSTAPNRHGHAPATGADIVAEWRSDPTAAKLLADWGRDAETFAVDAAAEAAEILGGLSAEAAADLLVNVDALPKADFYELMNHLADSRLARRTRDLAV